MLQYVVHILTTTVYRVEVLPECTWCQEKPTGSIVAEL